MNSRLISVDKKKEKEKEKPNDSYFFKKGGKTHFTLHRLSSWA